MEKVQVSTIIIILKRTDFWFERYKLWKMVHNKVMDFYKKKPIEHTKYKEIQIVINTYILKHNICV